MSISTGLSPTIEEIDRNVVWHGFTQMADYQPLVIERAQGNWLFDHQGRQLLDGVSSLWCVVHGHGHPRITAAIHEQVDQVCHVTSLGMGSATTARLAQRLVEVSPAGLSHVFFSSDGSSAVEAAIKMAFQYWQQQGESEQSRTKFVALGSAYHGDTTGSTSLGGVARFHQLFAPILFDVLRGPCPESYRLPEGIKAAEACDFYLQQLRQLLAKHDGQVAAIIVEPLVQGAAGMVMQPEGFLRGVRALADDFGCLLIADEVATGFGRTGRMFACERAQISPDLMCLGKGLSGGYLPIAATLASKQIWDAFLAPSEAGRQFFHGHTFGGNPVAAAAGLASLDVFEDEQTLLQLPQKIERLASHLQRIAQHPNVGDVRQCGMMVGIELVRDREQKTPWAAGELRGRRVCTRALERNVWIRPLGDVLVWMPALNMEDDELDMLGEVTLDSIVAEFDTVR